MRPPPVGAALSSRKVTPLSPEFERRSTEVTFFGPGAVVAALVKLYERLAANGSALPPFVERPPEPLKPVVAGRAGDGTGSAPPGSPAEASGREPPPPVAV